jgi:thioredoxin reductase
MAKKNRFIIKRTDKVRGVDDIVLESEGLTIGRLTGNDLVLNNRAVSRTHAGIKDIDGKYWIFNLSRANGTIVNGALVEGRVPIEDGNLVQIGPYVLMINYVGSALSINVEMDLEVVPIEAQADAGGEAEASGATVMIKAPAGAAAPAKKTGLFRGTRQLSGAPPGTAVLSMLMPEEDERALDIFWEKRKREAGKIAGRTLLHPRGGQKVGRAQNNWRPTLDLRKPWPKSYFVWAALIIGVLSLASYFVYESAFAPKPVSDPHFKVFTADMLSRRNIANDSNASCSSCHGFKSMESNCTSCHTTQSRGTAVAFSSDVYDEHKREQVTCSECHTEHQGSDKHAGLVNYGLCYNCHNGVYKIRTNGKVGPKGSILPIPHGSKDGSADGKVGYPIEAGKWTWKPLTADQLKKRRLPETLAQARPFVANAADLPTGVTSAVELQSFDQFHAVHMVGKMARTQTTVRGLACSDCHSQGSVSGVRGDAPFRDSPRGECGKCHGLTYGSSSIQSVQANCATCHRQHNSSEDLAQFVDDAARDGQKLGTYLRTLTASNIQAGGTAPLPSVNVQSSGGAGVTRQNKETIVLGSISYLGGIPWYVWVAMIGIVPLGLLVSMAANTARRKGYLMSATEQVKPADEVEKALTKVLDLDKLKAEGPAYPHPVINKETCIGCHACVDACPHDVLKIVNGKSTVIAVDQCMEDTACQVECPTNPKSCIVVNSTKKIPARKVPQRDPRLETNAPGIYMVGDISGTPLIKNAINEGRKVIDSILEDFKKNGRNPAAEYDVAVVGLGPGGLSSAVLAAKEGLSYVAFERDTMAGMIQQTYQAGKFVFYTPADKPVVGGVPLTPDPAKPEGNVKEAMVKGWFDAMLANDVKANEEEPVLEVKNENGFFTVTTEKGKQKEKKTYKVRKVILAVGNRGAPMKLGVTGEDMKFMVTPAPQVANHCPKCGTSRKGSQLFCVQCGQQLPVRTQPPFEDSRVQYKLTDAKDYIGKKCIVVGAGNSAIEVAIGLTGFESDGKTSKFNEGAEVILVVRSDFKGDLALGNKMAVYDCIDAGKIKAFFGCGIKELTEGKASIMNARSKEEKANVENDYIFALIGGEKPTKFLEGMGVKIGAEDKK